METLRNHTAGDGEELAVRSNGGDWLTAWHSPIEVPAGTPHGANAFCVTANDRVVLISNDGVHWGWPGGRPEGSESWEQTLRREILEETCFHCEQRTAPRILPKCVPQWSGEGPRPGPLHGGQRLGCCHGSQVSKSRIDELSPRMNCSPISGWRTASNRSIAGR